MKTKLNSEEAIWITAPTNASILASLRVVWAPSQGHNSIMADTTPVHNRLTYTAVTYSKLRMTLFIGRVLHPDWPVMGKAKLHFIGEKHTIEKIRWTCKQCQIFPIPVQSKQTCSQPLIASNTLKIPIKSPNTRYAYQRTRLYIQEPQQ